MSLIKGIIKKSGCKTDIEFTKFLNELQLNKEMAEKFAEHLDKDELDLLSHVVSFLRSK